MKKSILSALIFLSIGLTAIILNACTPQMKELPAQPVAAPSQQAAQPQSTAAQPSQNLTSKCVENYAPEVDYFPQKVTLQFAQNFQVEYHPNYKVVTVMQTSGPDKTDSRQYMLVQCGTPLPQGFDPKFVFEVPVKSLVSMSTTYLPFIDQFGGLDRLAAIDDATYISNEKVLQRIKDGKTRVVGSGAGVNVEQLIDLQPEVIFTYSSGIPDYDALPKLVDAKLKVAITSEQSEQLPLGRAEWGKFIALFLNQEAQAEQAFAAKAVEYNRLSELAAKAQTRPSVFLNTMYQGTWYVAGGKSFMAKLLADGGSNYLWAADSSSGSNPYSFEEVYSKAANADIWIPTGFWNSTADALKEDERYAQFAAFQKGMLYNNNARSTASGGNDFFESGTANPDVVLADLIKIFHPELLPEHTLYYYQKLK
jgi:iron complex transport system substrate-binding protein